MRWLKLDPQSIGERAKANGVTRRPPDLLASVVRGSIGFMLVSIAGFAPWAFGERMISRAIGEVGLYAVCALVFVGLSGVLLHRLVIGPGSLRRFYALFSIAFTVYAVGWTVGWMSLRGDPGSVAGLLLGTSAMGWLLVRAFDSSGELLRVVAVLFVSNALGYFLGGWVESSVAAMNGTDFLGLSMQKSERRIIAMLLWGACYGLGFGAGLGVAFFRCQSKARASLELTSR